MKHQGEQSPEGERALIVAWLRRAGDEHNDAAKSSPTIRVAQGARADECYSRAAGIEAGEHLVPASTEVTRG